MAGKFTFIPNVSGPGLVALEDIPEDVTKDVEEAYEALRGNDGRLRAEFATKEEADIWFKQAVSYGAQRPAGVLKVRRSPTKGLLKESEGRIFDFTVKADVPANAETKKDK